MQIIIIVIINVLSLETGITYQKLGVVCFHKNDRQSSIKLSIYSTMHNSKNQPALRFKRNKVTKTFKLINFLCISSYLIPTELIFTPQSNIIILTTKTILSYNYSLNMKSSNLLTTLACEFSPSNQP